MPPFGKYISYIYMPVSSLSNLCMHLARQTDARKMLLFKHRTFNSTNIQYNQHAPPQLSLYVSQMMFLVSE